MGKQQKKIPHLLISKISTATVCGKIKVKELAERKTPLKLMRVYGIAKKIITGNTTFGDWMGFVGSFEAVNLATGESFASGKCFLPVNITNMLAGQFVEKVETVRFGYEISARFNEANQCKYEYLVEELLKTAEENPIEQLRKEVDGTQNKK